MIVALFCLLSLNANAKDTSLFSYPLQIFISPGGSVTKIYDGAFSSVFKGTAFEFRGGIEYAPVSLLAFFSQSNEANLYPLSGVDQKMTVFDYGVLAEIRMMDFLYFGAGYGYDKATLTGNYTGQDTYTGRGGIGIAGVYHQFGNFLLMFEARGRWDSNLDKDNGQTLKREFQLGGYRLSLGVGIDL